MPTKNGIIQKYFLFVSLIFATSSSYYLSGGTANTGTGLFPELYYLKHASLLFLSVVGVAIMFLKRISKVNISFILVVPHLIYCGISYGVVFIQFISFLIATTILSYSYNTKYFLKNSTILVYFFIIIFIPLIDLLLNNGDFLLNSYYGRERLLLGYFHPKEAGIMFVIFFMMIILSGKLKTFFNRLFFYFTSLSFLYLVQSRNALLFLLNFIFFNFLTKKLGLTLATIVYLVLYVALPLIIMTVSFEDLDLLMSNRLSVWLGGFEFNLFGRFLEFSAGSNEDLFKYKFHIDNFYLEFLIEAGFFAFILLLSSLFYIGYKIRNTVLAGYRMISFYVAFLIFCIFDSGMFSTGNLLNVFAWSVIIFLIREKRNLHENNLR